MDKRKIEVRRDGLWQDIEMKDVKAGDTIRMFESEDKPVIGVDGKTEFVASADAELVEEGVYGCKCYD